MIRHPPRSPLFPYTPLFRSQAHSDRNRFLATAHIHPADDLSLPVEFTLNAVLHLTHHFHVVDRKSTRLNSSHANISYAVFCLKKKTNLFCFRHMRLFKLDST